ncbi:hypothetical protein KBD08_01660, partial [Candidatus Babeliales bacterium]|nr:hypothetical protein [Candidatus Babeliales bacterium]
MNQNKYKTNNIFTNSGIRDKAGSGYLQPNKLTTIAQAIATLLEEEFEDPCNILIATDTRTSSPEIKQALLDGFADFDHEIYDAGICPTPFVAKALRDYQPSSDQDEDDMEFDPEEEGFFDLGIVITASHNPAEYNGIKILTEYGYLTKEIEQEISSVYHDLMDNPYEDTNQTITPISLDLVSFYQSTITEQLSQTSLKNIAVTLDCAHGATAYIAPRIFNACGITTTAYNNSTDGSLINKNSACSQPSILLEQMQKNNTPWGCAFDGDGDRVIIAHQSGRIFDGDDLLFLLNYHPDYQEFKTVVGTVMTNSGIEQALQKMGKQLIRTYVGERNIIEQLIAQQAMIGSE